MSSDLTFGPSFKVKRWFTGYGELSFRWIQICIGSPMLRSIFFFLIFNIFLGIYLLYIFFFVCVKSFQIFLI